MSRGGEVQRFLDSDRDLLVSNVIESMASDGLRTICLAYKNFVTGLYNVRPTCVTYDFLILVRGLDRPTFHPHHSTLLCFSDSYIYVHLF